MKLQKYFSKHNSLFTVFFTRQQNRKLHIFTFITAVDVSKITVFATCATNGDDVLKSCLTLGEEGLMVKKMENMWFINKVLQTTDTKEIVECI